jgi:hypothetical protein
MNTPSSELITNTKLSQYQELFNLQPSYVIDPADFLHRGPSSYFSLELCHRFCESLLHILTCLRGIVLRRGGKCIVSLPSYFSFNK